MILITGATGLLGSHLLYNLLSAGKDVVAMYRSESSKGKALELIQQFYPKSKNVISKALWRKADLLDIVSLRKCLEDISVVYHCAGFVSFMPYDREQLYRINVEGTRNLVNICLKNNIEKFIHVSSIATLGKAIDNQQISEETELLYSEDHSYYVQTKFDGETEVWRAIEEGLPGIIVNPSVILGYGDWNEGSSAIFKTIWKGMPFYTSGGTGIVYVEDVCKAMIQFSATDITGERYIINGENISYKNLFSDIADGLNRNKPKYKVSSSLLEVLWRIQKLLHLLFGIKPTISKNTARTAKDQSLYSNEKLCNFLIDFRFTPKETYIPKICACFVKNK